MDTEFRRGERLKKLIQIIRNLVKVIIPFLKKWGPSMLYVIGAIIGTILLFLGGK